MKLHELKPNPGAKKKSIRRGRGNGSKGTFSGRGCKGQNARSGGGVRPGFEGGQTTFLQRMPKRKGFTNPNRVAYTAVNLTKLEEAFKDGETVSLETLKGKNIIRSNAKQAKILGAGDISKKVTLEGVSFSATAQKKIEKAGGKVPEAKKEDVSKAKKKEKK